MGAHIRPAGCVTARAWGWRQACVQRKVSLGLHVEGCRVGSACKHIMPAAASPGRASGTRAGHRLAGLQCRAHCWASCIAGCSEQLTEEPCSDEKEKCCFDRCFDSANCWSPCSDGAGQHRRVLSALLRCKCLQHSTGHRHGLHSRPAVFSCCAGATAYPGSRDPRRAWVSWAMEMPALLVAAGSGGDSALTHTHSAAVRGETGHARESAARLQCCIVP